MAEQETTVTIDEEPVVEQTPAQTTTRRRAGRKAQTLLGPVEELDGDVEKHSAEVEPEVALVVEEKPVNASNVDGPLRDNPPAGKIIEEGEPVEFEAKEVDNQLVVQEDVYRRTVPFNSLRVHYTLIYSKGTALPPTAAIK